MEKKKILFVKTFSEKKDKIEKFSRVPIFYIFFFLIYLTAFSKFLKIS